MKTLRFHDYRLQNYEVSSVDKTITLNLALGNDGNYTDFSRIVFGDMALYDFVHTAHAIITDIEEVSVATLVRDESNFIIKWNEQQGVDCWKQNADETVNYLESNQYRAWYITSAIGFWGFVVAKSISGD